MMNFFLNRKIFFEPEIFFLTSFLHYRRWFLFVFCKTKKIKKNCDMWVQFWEHIFIPWQNKKMIFSPILIFFFEGVEKFWRKKWILFWCKKSKKYAHYSFRETGRISGYFFLSRRIFCFLIYCKKNIIW